MMFNEVKMYQRIEQVSLVLSFIAVVLLFINVFLCLFFSGLSAVVASAGMLMYAVKSDKLYFSKILLYALFISAVPILIIFFQHLKQV